MTRRTGCVRACAALAALAAVLASSGVAGAHDHWLAADRAVLASPGDVAVRLVYGEHLAPEGEHPFEAKKLARFGLVAGKWARELRAAGVEGKKPLGKVTLTRAGGYVFVADRTTQYLTLDPQKFEEYLEEEKLSEVLAERMKRGEQKKPGRERYTRFLKSLVVVGEGGDSAAGLVLGQRLEIVLESDPAALRVGDVLTVRVLFEGQPLSGALVSAYAKDDLSSAELSARTGADGRVDFRVARGGSWMVRLVSMRRCEGCTDADWESFWASYAFPIATADPARAPGSARSR